LEPQQNIVCLGQLLRDKDGEGRWNGGGDGGGGGGGGGVGRTHGWMWQKSGWLCYHENLSSGNVSTDDSSGLIVLLL
jgi:hypothetical protein